MKIVIGVSYNKQNNAEKIAIYDIAKDKINILTTRKAKEMFNADMLAVKNADFTFFVNSVNFTIGEERQYPLLRIQQGPNKKEIYQLESGIIIYDYKPTKENKFHTALVIGNNVKIEELDIKTLAKFKQSSYKCNYDLNKDGSIHLVYKEDSVEKTKDYSDYIGIIKAQDEGWYKLIDNTMVPTKPCPVLTFTSDTIANIQGFSGSNIEEVDLRGCKRVLAGAFKNCPKLSKVTFSNSLIQIDNQAFLNCPNLKELRLPPSLQILGTGVYNGPLVYMNNSIEGAIKPFSKHTKIIMYGKASSKSNKINVAFNEKDNNVAILEINPTNGETNKRVIKKDDIDILDVYINYENNSVLKGSTIICGKSGNDYVYIDKDLVLKTGTFEKLRNKRLSDGIVTNEEIIPKNKEWVWQYINIQGDSEGKTGKSVVSHVVQTADQGNVLDDNQSLIISDYIDIKCGIDKSAKRLIKSIKLSAKVEQEKAKYPGVEWVKGPMYHTSNLPVSILSNPDLKQDKRGWWSCYFHHPTMTHWLVYGQRDGKTEVTFSFGHDCFQEFTGISDDQMARYLAYEGQFVQAITEVTKIVKENKYLQHKKECKNFYDIVEKLYKNKQLDLLGQYGNIIERSLRIKCPIPKMVREDAMKAIPEDNMHDILLNIVDNKNKETIEIIYNYPLLRTNSMYNVKEIQEKFKYFVVNSWRSHDANK